MQIKHDVSIMMDGFSYLFICVCVCVCWELRVGGEASIHEDEINGLLLELKQIMISANGNLQPIFFFSDSKHYYTIHFQSYYLLLLYIYIINDFA